MSEANPQKQSVEIARQLAAALENRRHEYAIGGAIALGYWAVPRGTLDVDLTLYLPPDKPSQCIWLLQDLECEVDSGIALQSFSEHGFCRVVCQRLDVDVFLPTFPFYEVARSRRRRVQLGDQPVWIWDAETLSVFKMMFFRRKDLADIEQILRMQGARFDQGFVRSQLESIHGSRDPRLAQWDQLVQEIKS